MQSIIKYPRTRHIEGSRLQAGDEDLKSVKFEAIRGKYIILEEKVDGANCGISFSSDGTMFLQSRGHFLNGGYTERQFDLFKTWTGVYQQDLFELLGDRYVMYGEWLYAKHTVYYDQLSHYFMEFDLYDKQQQIFLSTAERQKRLHKFPFITSVRVLFAGQINSLQELKSYLGESAFRSSDCFVQLQNTCEKEGLSLELAMRQTDQENLMEGIYIKEEEAQAVINRYKFVRASFLNRILDSETHWQDRPMIPNRLRAGVELFPCVKEKEAHDCLLRSEGV